MKCKFCEAELTGIQCEYSHDPETGDIQYCGNEECPACTMCQGREVTPDLVRIAREIAALRARR